MRIPIRFLTYEKYFTVLTYDLSYMRNITAVQSKPLQILSPSISFSNKRTIKQKIYEHLIN